LSVYYTGATNSPLYFIYFIPLIVHAFHRDLGMVVLYGFGGVIFYAMAILKSIAEMTPVVITNLGARIFFMLLTVSIACLALTILRKQDEVDQKRIRRLKNLTLVSETLNQMTSMNELQEISVTLMALIHQGLGKEMQPWARFLFVQKDATLMRAITDPNNDRSDLPKEISTLSCPVMKNNAPFLLDDASKGTECPTEQFSFGSHICMPIAGAENESFGVLFLGSPYKHAFLSEETQFLEYIAKSLGLSIQRLNRMEELRKSLEMNSWVMAATIASSRSANDTYSAVLEGISNILRADTTTLSIFQKRTGQLKTVKNMGGETPENRSLLMPLKTIKGEPLGVIKAARNEATEKFSAIEIETAATFAARAALAIENAQSHETQREQINSFIEEANRKKAA
jgi:GAF domain-containing protein